jgi:hypothetical protein
MDFKTNSMRSLIYSVILKAIFDGTKINFSAKDFSLNESDKRFL